MVYYLFRKNMTIMDWISCQSTDEMCPSFCLKIYDPVCGEDGKVYPNQCIMRMKNCR